MRISDWSSDVCSSDRWSRESAQLWTDFAAELEETTGIALAHRNRGGLALLLGEAEVEQRRREIALMKQQAGATGFDCEIIDPRAVRAMLPRLRPGAEVAGASLGRAWCRGRVGQTV